MALTAVSPNPIQDPASQPSKPKSAWQKATDAIKSVASSISRHPILFAASCVSLYVMHRAYVHLRTTRGTQLAASLLQERRAPFQVLLTDLRQALDPHADSRVENIKRAYAKYRRAALGQKWAPSMLKLPTTPQQSLQESAGKVIQKYKNQELTPLNTLKLAAELHDAFYLSLEREKAPRIMHEHWLAVRDRMIKTFSSTPLSSELKKARQAVVDVARREKELITKLLDEAFSQEPNLIQAQLHTTVNRALTSSIMRLADTKWSSAFSSQ